MKKLLIAASVCAMSINALAYNINQIEIKTNPALVGKMRIEMKLNKPWFRSAGERGLDIDQASELIQLDNVHNISSIEYNLFIDSNINVEDADSQSAILSGKLKIEGSKKKFKGTNIKSDELDIVSDLKFKADIDCDNIITSNVNNNKLIISLENFANLSACRGDDIHHYTLNGVGKRNVAEGRNNYTMEDDIRLGKEFVNQYDIENAHQLLPIDHPMTIFMQKQMERIAAVSDMPNLKPVVKVINANIINAFALPGGYVYVFRGLLEQSPSLDATMAVLAHEWAHITARHGTEGLTKARRTLMLGLGVAAAGLIGAEFIDDEKKLLKLIIQGSAVALGIGGSQLLILGRSRKNEFEADRLGSQYAALTGYDPTGIAQMFRVFKRLSPGSSTTFEKMLSTHPHHDARIETNLIHSALFFPQINPTGATKTLVENERIAYSDALAQLSTEPLPSLEESETIANAFLSNLHSQNENLLLKEVKSYLKKLAEDQEEESEREPSSNN